MAEYLHPAYLLETNGSSSSGPNHVAFGRHQVLTLLMPAIMMLVFIYLYRSRMTQSRDGMFTANKLFPFEPSFFARVRWSIGAIQILEAADKKAQGRPYRLARGDKELVVLPTSLIPELNRASADLLDSRQSHAFTLLGHLTGMQVVEKTSYHVRMLLGRISPALPELLAPTAARMSAAIEREFPRSEDWTVMKPLPATVRCFSEGIALALFGAKMAEDPKLVELTHKLTEDVFKVAFIMRLVPAFLQPILVWLVPVKWSMNRRWRELASFVVPEVARRKQSSNSNSVPTSPDLISWMVKDGRTELERDPNVLATLCGSLAAGSIYSIANFVCRTLSELVAHPDVLNQVRDEIRAQDALNHGRWDMAALSNLDRLESAMKETARLAPGTVIVYSRVVQRDCVLGGVELKKGQFVTMSGQSRATDPAIFEDPKTYKGLRFCDEEKLEEHRARPFRSIDADILTWGVGRWACPGRQVADMAVKILLVKLLDENDFAFVGGKPLRPNAIHEFLFFHPNNKMLVRRRNDAVGIEF